MKIEPLVEEGISLLETQFQNTDVRNSLQDEASAATSTTEWRQLESSECSGTSTTNGKQSDQFDEPVPTNLLKKEGGCDGFQET